MRRRIILLLMLCALVPAMIAGSATTAAADDVPGCPPGTHYGPNPVTGEPGCVVLAETCPAGTEPVPLSGPPSYICWGPFVTLTKEACENGGYAVLGYKNQGQCLKAANQASK